METEVEMAFMVSWWCNNDTPRRRGVGKNLGRNAEKERLKEAFGEKIEVEKERGMDIDIEKPDES